MGMMQDQTCGASKIQRKDGMAEFRTQSVRGAQALRVL